MFTILDRYIIKKFLGTFIFILSMIMAISIVFDVAERIDDFIESEASFWIIVSEYYFNFVLFYANLFSSLLIFISVILFTSKMASRTEIIAILAGGVSFKRLLRPFFFSAAILTLLALLLNHFVVPKANRARLDFMENYMWGSYRIKDNDMHREIEPGTIAYVESMNMEYHVGYKFSIEKWEGNKLSYKLLSDRAIYSPEEKKWTIRNYHERWFLEDNKEKLLSGLAKDTVLNLRPEDFGERIDVINTLNYFDLNKRIEKEKLKGSNMVTFFELEKHQRTSYPFATFILTLIAVSVASRKVRGGIGIHLAFSIITAVVYIFMMKIASVAATNAGMNPLLAVWIPNIFFGALAIYLYFKAPK